MGQVEEIKRRREKKEKLLEKSTKRIGDFQHRPGIPRDRSPSPSILDRFDKRSIKLR